MRTSFPQPPIADPDDPVRPSPAATGPARRRTRRGAATLVTLLLLAPVLGGVYLSSASPHRPTIEERLARERAFGQALLRARERAYEERIERLLGRLHGLEGRMADRDEVEARVGEVQRAVSQVERNVATIVGSELERTLGQRPELREARDVVARMKRADAAAERIIAKYGPSVCLVQGAYGFGRLEKGVWRFLREAPPELLRGVDVSGDKVPLMLEGDGPLFTVDYTGTGFLVDAGGIVITNRHIAEPWWRSDAARPLVEDGYEPRFVRLRAYFPGRETPVRFDRARTVIAADADLAALFFTPFESMPPAIPLANPREVAPGRRVLLLGYPSGLDALIARSGDDFTDDLEARGGIAPGEVLDALAARDLVRPLPTQGHVGDVLDDKIVFDAATAVGGSGGPLVDMEGRVVAINYGILKAFRGANFGVPVAFARDLLARARR